MARWPATGTGRHQVADASWRDRSVAIAGASAAGNGVPHQESAWDSPYVATRRRTLRPVMRSDQRLTTGDVEAVAGQVLGRVVGCFLKRQPHQWAAGRLGRDVAALLRLPPLSRPTPRGGHDGHQTTTHTTRRPGDPASHKARRIESGPAHRYRRAVRACAGGRG